jgi:hypothetical protein
MKRYALLAAVLALPLALAAQNVTSPTASVTQPANGPADIAGQLYAANFAHWTIKPSELGLSWTSPSQCYGTSGGINFKLFSTSAPITIVDLGVPANTETVTPSIASYNGAGCSVGLPATHAHSNYYLQSGTLGLQEALNWVGSSYAIVVLTPDWTAMGGTTAMQNAAVIGANTTILDQRTNAITVTNPITTTTLTASTSVTPTVVAGTGLGTAALPWGNIILGTAATNVATVTPATMAAARAITLADPLGPDTLAYLQAAQTFTNKTISGLTLNTGYINSSLQTVELTGGDWSCGTGGTVSTCVTAVTIGTSGSGGLLSFTLPLSAKTWTFQCNGVVGQATGATANTWAVQTATTGATNVTLSYTMQTAATSLTGGATTDTASTITAISLAPTWTLGGTGTKMPFQINGTIEGAAAAGTVVNIQLIGPTIGDLVTIYRGATCHVF